MDKIIAYEICKKNRKLISIWDMERIAGAFNNGRGTLKDFKTYMENNKQCAYFKICQ